MLLTHHLMWALNHALLAIMFCADRVQLLLPVSFISDVCTMLCSTSAADGVVELWKNHPLLTSTAQVSVHMDIEGGVNITAEGLLGFIGIFQLVRVCDPKKFAKILAAQVQNMSENIGIGELGAQPTSFLCAPFLLDNDTLWEQSSLDNLIRLNHIRLDQEIFLVQASSKGVSGNDMCVKEIYSVGSTTYTREIPLSSWSIFNNGNFYLNIIDLRRLSNRRRDLGGLKIKTVAQKDDADDEGTFVNTLEDGSQRLTGGCYLNLVLDLRQFLNFSIVPVDGRGWIEVAQNTDGNKTKLTGMAEQMLNMEADWSVSLNALLYQRAEQLYYLPSVDYREAFVFYRDSAAPPSALSMLKPFRTIQWLFMIVMWVIILCAYLLSHVFLLKGTGSALISDGITCLFSTVTGQGWYYDPKYNSLRLVVLTSIGTNYLLYSSYNAKLIAFMSTIPTYIHSPDELALKGYVTFTHPAYPQYAINLMKSAKNQEKVWKDSLMYFKNYSDTVQKVVANPVPFAFVSSGLDFYVAGAKANIPGEVLCQLSYMRNDRAGRVQHSMLLRLGSPLREVLKYGTLKVIEVGLVHRCRIIHGRHKFRKCYHQYPLQRRRTNTFTVELRHSSCAFGALLFGIVASLIMICAEKQSQIRYKFLP